MEIEKTRLAPKITLAGVSIDTAQTLGIGQQHNSGQILNYDTPSAPSDLAKKIGKIIYNADPLLAVQKVDNNYVLKQ